jgi:hypothetical protein
MWILFTLVLQQISYGSFQTRDVEVPLSPLCVLLIPRHINNLHPRFPPSRSPSVMNGFLTDKNRPVQGRKMHESVIPL